MGLSVKCYFMVISNRIYEVGYSKGVIHICSYIYSRVCKAKLNSDIILRNYQRSYRT